MELLISRELTSEEQMSLSILLNQAVYQFRVFSMSEAKQRVDHLA
jgi:hypothetical protein